METKELASDIVDFCLKYRIFNELVERDEIKKRVEYKLEDNEFIESLINTIIVKTKNRKYLIDTEKIKKLLLDLEKQRLELEYGSISNRTSLQHNMNE